jgi:hypothetical protein
MVKSWVPGRKQFKKPEKQAFIVSWWYNLPFVSKALITPDTTLFGLEAKADATAYNRALKRRYE